MLGLIEELNGFLDALFADVFAEGEVIEVRGKLPLQVRWI